LVWTLKKKKKEKNPRQTGGEADFTKSVRFKKSPGPQEGGCKNTKVREKNGKNKTARMGEVDGPVTEKPMRGVWGEVRGNRGKKQEPKTKKLTAPKGKCFGRKEGTGKDLNLERDHPWGGEHKRRTPQKPVNDENKEITEKKRKQWSSAINGHARAR